ncbi:helix-turn-helix domain-containing protein [Enterococcus sp. BWB1-3]|uniref:helix-turn-helix domain-containing protein n=1 Tax=unclassified Enterococcus TaxID=2608891 RepID=UPI0019246FEB|nr:MULTISPECIES: helix-turn-helix domain-containing protein [unclassified Enterococcus]MBL1229022.1 helix-turn-helix domain-containing protein [Enterococcus sp. BWB1-3]MCB5952291.1 helix-turn-helix domain-containing protein [Enterococcus sp. BWT-B8]MCB5955480.1 helix-turn-helix domain-containing protein [Enterococcus sp. CWB-B31]
MFEELILEDITKRKLTLFNLLAYLPDDYYSINFLESNLDFSYSRVSYLLELIQQDLDEINQEPTNFITDQGIHYDRSVSYDQYYQYLITRSIPYLLLLSIIYYPQDTLDDFCRKNFLSKASVIRKSKSLNNYFKQFNIKLNISQLKLTGEERMIRIVLYALVWFTSQNANLPDVGLSIDYEKVQNNVDPLFPESRSYSASKQIQLLLDIVYLRVTNGYFLTETATISAYIPTSVELSKDFFGAIVDNDAVLEAEAQFSALLLVITPNFYSEKDPRFYFLEHYLEIEENQATVLFKEFWHFLETTYGFSKYEHRVIYGNTANIIFPITILKKAVPGVLTANNNSNHIQNKYFLELHDSFKVFFRKISKRKNFSWLSEQIALLSIAFALLMFPSWEKLKNNKMINVGLIAESNYLLNQHLINFLDELTFVKLETFTENYSDFDLIIATSSCLFPKECTASTFVFRYSKDNQKQYVALYQMLKEVQNNKTAPRELS